MISDKRLTAIKQQALKSISAKANKPENAGVAMVAVTPHEALKMVDAYLKVNNDQDQQPSVP